MAAALILLIAATLAGDYHAAEVDRARYSPDQWASLYYATTAGIDPLFGDADDAGSALQFTLASLSPQPIIERATPVKIGADLYRIDLRELQIRPEDWRELIAHDPYSRGQPNSLVARAEWLTLQLADATENAEAYYRIVFAGQRPKTRDEALKWLGVDDTVAYRFGLIEGKSGVSVQGHRWIENRPMSRGYAWGTRDVARLTAERDPLEQPEGDFEHDAEEWLIYRRKFSAATGAQGVLLAALLTDGAGKLIERADTNIVEDHTRFRGHDEIRLIGSCLQCHDHGPNIPTQNELRAEILAGVDRFAQDADLQAIEAFHFADVATSLERNRADYAAAVRAAVGLEPAEAALLFQRAVNRYDQDVDLDRAAYELDLTATELRQRLALASTASGLPTRIVGLAHHQTIPREAWEQAYFAVWLECKRHGSP